jgi:hypothetical protein
MPEGDTGTPTWKFTQYVTTLEQASKQLFCSAKNSMAAETFSQSSPVHRSHILRCPLTHARRKPCLLTCVSRCFGDKGDVEDITEGTAHFLQA